MAKYKIYAGVFAGENYCGTFEYDTEEEALGHAHELAVEEYEVHAGFNGIMSYEECREDAINTWGCEDWNDDDFWYFYMENVENWISYYVEDVEE